MRQSAKNAKAERAELVAKQIVTLEKILAKLEEIRYASIDVETGIANLLVQSKKTNALLEELLDKRH